MRCAVTIIVLMGFVSWVGCSLEKERVTPSDTMVSEPQPIPPPPLNEPVNEPPVEEVVLDSVMAEAITNAAAPVAVSERLIKDHTLSEENVIEEREPLKAPNSGGRAVGGLWVKINPNNDEGTPVSAIDVPVPGSNVSVGHRIGDEENEDDMTTIRIRKDW